MDELIIIAVCLFLNAIFAAYEMAFVSVARPDLRGMAKNGDKAARRLLHMRDNPERTLSIIQIGITLVGAIAAAVGGSGAAETLEPYLISRFRMGEFPAEILSVILVVLPITYLSVVVGELVPKTLALRAPRTLALKGAPALFVADRFLSPVITVLEWSTKKILSTFFEKSNARTEAAGHTTLEIDDLSPLHQKFVMNMVEIEKRKIKDIMVQWPQVNHINLTDSLEIVTQAVLSSGHTRLPVVDHGHVVGVLHTKEFVALKESGEHTWVSILRPVIKVLTTDSSLGVLRLMQEKRSHLAVVYAPAQELMGIVTMEDILEEVVGEIYDEDDDGKIRRIFAARVRSRNS